MRIFAYWLIFGICSTTVSEASGWLKSFTNYIKQGNIEYQVLLLFDGLSGRSESLKVENIVQGISRKVPALKISFQEATIEKAHELSQSTSFYNPRTTMIVSIHSSKVSGCMSQLNQTLSFVSQISEARRRPRCLIILPEEEEKLSYLEFLKRMWSNQFLDVTILELEKPKRKEYFPNVAPEIATLHQLNPFTDRYDKFKYSKMTDWFPEKTHNLGGLTMKVALFHYPPFVDIVRNITGHAIRIHGLDVTLTEALSKKMNFKVDWVIPKLDQWGVGSCKKINNSRILQSLVINEIQYVGVRLTRYSSCEKSFHDWSGSIEIFSNVLVVPIFAKRSVLELSMWKIVNLFVLVGVFLSTWLITRMLPFQSRNWNLLQIVRIVLGTATPHEPRRTAERILFGAMLFSCLLHSSVIFTALTDMSLHTETEPEMKTAADVLHSNLEPVVYDPYYPSMVKETEGSERVLLEKAIKVNSRSQACLGRLLKKKKLACISRTDVADWMMQNNRDSCGRPRIRILEDPLLTASSGIVMEARSPYIERFDKVLLRLVQSGVTDKWQHDRFNYSSLVENKDEGCAERETKSSQLERQVIYLLLFGYASAIVSFICEVIFAYVRKKVN